MNPQLLRIFPIDETDDYKYVVALSRYQGKLLLSRHKQRRTWETQGGHIEPGETPEQAMRRELWEECGAEAFTLTPLFGYLAGDEESAANGAVFLAEIEALGALPESEMARVQGFDVLPKELTYPGITPRLFEKAGFKIK